ncbi:hypothetical protein [Vreelandella glaciei]|uniref:hypothetical protein n=1 Tax=Vreelandella glaciei TaxID=186761 RepID=UPI003002B386
MRPCSAPSLRREALLQLAAAHDSKQQTALSGAVKAMYDQPDEQWGGLWISLDAGQLTGAIWVQPLPMNMAQLWLPKAEGVHARALLNSALELAQQAGFKQYAQQRLLAWKGGGERSEAPTNA